MRSCSIIWGIDPASSPVPGVSEILGVLIAPGVAETVGDANVAAVLVGMLVLVLVFVGVVATEVPTAVAVP